MFESFGAGEASRATSRGRFGVRIAAALFAAELDELACVFSDDSAALQRVVSGILNVDSKENIAVLAVFRQLHLRVIAGDLGRSMCSHRRQREICVNHSFLRRRAQGVCELATTSCGCGDG